MRCKHGIDKRGTERPEVSPESCKADGNDP